MLLCRVTLCPLPLLLLLLSAAEAFSLGATPTTREAQAIADEIFADFVSAEVDKVELVFTKFVSLITSEPTIQVRGACGGVCGGRREGGLMTGWTAVCTQLQRAGSHLRGSCRVQVML